MEQFTTTGTGTGVRRFLKGYNVPRIPLGNWTSMQAAKTRPFLNGASSYFRPYGAHGVNSRPIKVHRLPKATPTGRRKMK